MLSDMVNLTKAKIKEMLLLHHFKNISETVYNVSEKAGINYSTHFDIQSATELF